MCLGNWLNKTLLNGNIFSPYFSLLPSAHSSFAADDMGVPVVGVIQEYLPQIQHIITVQFSPCLNNHILGNRTVGDVARCALSKNLIPCNWEKTEVIFVPTCAFRNKWYYKANITKLCKWQGFDWYCILQSLMLLSTAGSQKVAGVEWLVPKSEQTFPIFSL